MPKSIIKRPGGRIKLGKSSHEYLFSAFIYVHTFCIWAAKALVHVHQPSLLENAINTKSYVLAQHVKKNTHEMNAYCSIFN